jgi:hypothetical protein
MKFLIFLPGKAEIFGRHLYHREADSDKNEMDGIWQIMQEKKCPS